MTARKPLHDKNCMENIMLDALKRIKPKSKRVPKEVSMPFKAINESLKKNKLKAEAVLGGSFAKGTYLAGDFDVDIFVRFDLKKYDGADISGLLETALIPFKPERLHGSRDYFQFFADGINFEIVPVLAISKPEEARNVTDCSPLHVIWVEKNIKNLHDDIRLAKQFLKSCRAYGAESYIRGFSGHVIDLLVIMHGGFLKLLKAAAGWTPPVIIDHYNAHKGKAMSALNEAKIQSPLILIDPVHAERNAAASLSQESFERFVRAARGFLEKPSGDYFTIKDVDLEGLAKKGTLVTLKAIALDGKKDVVGSKLVQAFEKLKERLSVFKIVEAGWTWKTGTEGLFYFVLKDNELAASEKIIGPPQGLKEHANAFLSRHPLAKPENGRLVAVENRTETRPEQILKRAISEPFIKDRVKSLIIHLPETDTVCKRRK